MPKYSFRDFKDMAHWAKATVCLLPFSMTVLLEVQGQTNNLWLPVPMLSQKQINAGVWPGGEGCQYPQSIDIDAQDGSFILYGTDVGGMYRSVNGGRLFRPCNTGVSTCGAAGFAIDPHNRNRCLEVGDGGGNVFNIFGGVYLSVNEGASWANTCPKWLDANGSGYWWSTHGREQIAYDPSSYNSSLGYCTVAYWVEEGNPQEPMGGLYKTLNGGVSWGRVATSVKYGGDDNAHSIIKVHPRLGYVYIANQSGASGTNHCGIWRSINGGESFAQILSGSFPSLDVVLSQPTNVWTASGNTIFLSTNSCTSFSSFSASGIGNILSLKVSPVNAQNMLADDMNAGRQRDYSTNGGLNWTATANNLALDFYPEGIAYNDRDEAQVWHPTNSSVAWCVGPGDLMVESTNAGVSEEWANNGNNGIMTGGGFNFNAMTPDILYMGSQDYNGALTTNGGRSWIFINLSLSSPTDGDPWGWVYGAYAANANLLFGGNQAYGSSTKTLWQTSNQGTSSSQKEPSLSGLATAAGDPANSSVLFCWNYRSPNNGASWYAMNNCLGVLTFDAGNSNLYGAYNNTVVKSINDGLTWTTVTTLSANVIDVAVDPVSKRVWATTGAALYSCDPPGYSPDLVSQPNGNASSVALDPVNPNIIYLAGTPGTWVKSPNTVVRSLDGGGTWEGLNNRSDLGYDGANCASWCRVHPLTRELWVGTVCFGMWRFGTAAWIATNPAAQTVNEGQNAKFTVSTGGSQPLFYQWQFMGTNIPGATASTYVCSNATPSSAGYYSVIVSNLASAVVSSNTRLQVVPSTPKLDGIAALANGQMVLSVTASSAGTFGFDVSTNLLTWTSLTSFVSPATSFNFTNAPEGSPWIFYRAWRR